MKNINRPRQLNIPTAGKSYTHAPQNFSETEYWLLKNPLTVLPHISTLPLSNPFNESDHLPSLIFLKSPQQLRQTQRKIFVKFSSSKSAKTSTLFNKNNWAERCDPTESFLQNQWARTDQTHHPNRWSDPYEISKMAQPFLIRTMNRITHITSAEFTKVRHTTYYWPTHGLIKKWNTTTT